MSSYFVALSRCLKKMKDEIYLFHFNGMYLGHKIRLIEITGEERTFIKHDDYIIYLECKDIVGDKIISICHKHINLKDLKRLL